MKKFASLLAVAAMSAGLMTSFAAAEDEPKLVKASAPEYPRGAERRELEGYVVVSYNVTDGKVKDVEVVEATPAGIFDRAVLRALEDWQYEAGATATGMKKRFDFNLGG